MRCFYALELPVAERDSLAALIVRMHGVGDVKWTPVGQLHLTLVFLGELAEAKVAAACAALAELSLPPLRLQVASLGAFPPRGTPRVLWAGLEGDLAPLAAMQARLAAQAAGFGVRQEARPWTPHITLGRIKTPHASRVLAAKWAELGKAQQGTPFSPPSVVLFASELTPKGAVHTPLLSRAMPG